METDIQVKAGQWRQHSKGYKAYLTNPLPPAMAFSMALQSQLAKANLSLGRLDGIGRMLPNPYLLINPYLRNEAVLSSKIEGTRSTLTDLFEFELSDDENNGTHEDLDVQEVENYVRAMEYGIERLKALPISLRLMRELHEILMQGVRGQNKTPGEFRHSQNWIGPPGCTLNTASFVPPPPEELLDQLGSLENYIHSNPQEPDLIQCAFLHGQFEIIHPFLDGNGRIGRLLITLFLIERNLLSLPLLYLSAYFERNRSEYYERLTNISAKDDWEGWLLYFLQGVEDQANRSVRTANQILALKQTLEESLKEQPSSGLLLKTLDFLFLHPVINVNRLAKKLEVSFQTSNTLILKLEELGVIREITGQRRNRRYFFSQLVQLIAES